MFSLGFLENIDGAFGVAVWRTWFLEKKSNFLLSSQMALLSKMKALELRRSYKTRTSKRGKRFLPLISLINSSPLFYGILQFMRQSCHSEKQIISFLKR